MGNATVGSAVTALVQQSVAVPAARQAQPVDPATVTGTPEQRLKAFEAVIEAAASTADESMAAAKARFAIEAGTALRAIHTDELWKVTHASFEAYVEQRWKTSRQRAHQLMEAAPAMLASSKIFDRPVVESHARVLAPVIQEHGIEAARAVVDTAKASGGKLTADALRAARKKAGYEPPVSPVQASKPGPRRPERSPIERLEEARERLSRVASLVSRTAVHDATGEHPVHASRVLRAITSDLVDVAEALGLRVVTRDGEPVSKDTSPS